MLAFRVHFLDPDGDFFTFVQRIGNAVDLLAADLRDVDKPGGVDAQINKRAVQFQAFDRSLQLHFGRQVGDTGRGCFSGCFLSGDFFGGNLFRCTLLGGNFGGIFLSGNFFSGNFGGNFHGVCTHDRTLLQRRFWYSV